MNNTQAKVNIHFPGSEAAERASPSQSHTPPGFLSKPSILTLSL